jgi:hypothetical protein
MVLGGGATVAQASRICGADPVSVEDLAMAQVKRWVLDRDSWTCWHCGQRATVVHDRFSPSSCTSAGITELPSGLAGVVSLCDDAHRLAHDVIDPVMAARGFRLRRWQNPALEPLILVSGEGTPYPLWLTASCEYSTTDPREASWFTG